jgi:Domain of unknown function (DUF4303)
MVSLSKKKFPPQLCIHTTSMTDMHADLRRIIVDAIRSEMSTEFGADKLHGFALCIDDDVMTLYSAACTQSWVSLREPDYGGIGYIYVEWDQNAGDSHFDSISSTVAAMADDDRSSPEQRFEAIVLALQDCRNEGLFDADTLLCCGSTDPSNEMELLAMRAVDRLNTTATADAFALHLGYQEHRENNR